MAELKNEFNIIDRRLADRPAARYGSARQTVTTGESEALTDMVSRAKTAMKIYAPVKRLRFFAHGIIANGHRAMQMTKNTIAVPNAAKLAPLASMLDGDAKVFVFSCQAMVDGEEDTSISMIQAVAKALGAPVYAADVDQIFSDKTYTPEFFGSSVTIADMGAWEGQVSLVQPDGTSTLVTSAAAPEQ